jgi:hypothetical protein
MNNQNQKGAAMNTHPHTDIWIYRTKVALGLIVLMSVVGTLTLGVMNRTVPEIISALGIVAIGGLARLLIPSPLSQRSFG